jgi:hypothetical protein
MKIFKRGTALPSSGRATMPTTASPLAAAPSHEAIARRAYLKWQARGCRGGAALQDWLEAEAELKAELGQARRS